MGQDVGIHLDNDSETTSYGHINTMSVFVKYGEILDYHYLTEKNFRRNHKIAKSDYQLHYVCLSLRPQGTIRRPLNGFALNVIFENF